MTQEEYSALKEGDKVWYFKISFSRTLYGNLAVGLIAELEKTKDEDRFKVIQVKKGTSTKVGRVISAGDWGSIRLAELFKDYNDGIDYWNSVVHNEVDRLTHYFEDAVKHVEGKLLKKND